MRIFWILVGAAVVSTLVVTVVGIALLVTDPEPGSDAEGMLGFLAALSGLATGLLFAAAAIYASVRRLWEHMQPWVRWGFLALILVVAVASVIIANSGSDSGG